MSGLIEWMSQGTEQFQVFIETPVKGSSTMTFGHLLVFIIVIAFIAWMLSKDK